MSQSHSAADGHTRDCKVRREALWLIPFGGAVLGHTLDQNSGLGSQRLSAAEGYVTVCHCSESLFTVEFSFSLFGEVNFIFCLGLGQYRFIPSRRRPAETSTAAQHARADAALNVDTYRS